MLSLRLALIQQIECWQTALVISLNFYNLSIFLFKTRKLLDKEAKSI